jgi:uncharacterized membrane protein
MRIEQTVRINEAMESVWAVLIDGANWPEWTASTSSAKRLEHAPFGLGSRTTVSQPKLRTTTWTSPNSSHHGPSPGRRDRPA